MTPSKASVASGDARDCRGRQELECEDGSTRHKSAVATKLMAFATLGAIQQQIVITEPAANIKPDVVEKSGVEKPMVLKKHDKHFINPSGRSDWKTIRRTATWHFQ